MYISENLAFQHRTEFQVDFFEHIWADIRVNGKVFAINGIYRPPNEDGENHLFIFRDSRKYFSSIE